MQEAVRIMAKDLVRTRNYIKKFYLMMANNQAISLKLQATSSAQPRTQASCIQPGYETKPGYSEPEEGVQEGERDEER